MEASRDEPVGDKVGFAILKYPLIPDQEVKRVVARVPTSLVDGNVKVVLSIPFLELLAYAKRAVSYYLG